MCRAARRCSRSLSDDTATLGRERLKETATSTGNPASAIPTIAGSTSHSISIVAVNARSIYEPAVKGCS